MTNNTYKIVFIKLIKQNKYVSGVGSSGLEIIKKGVWINYYWTFTN